MTRIAIIQQAPAVLDRAASIATAAVLAADAARRGARLVVFPEAFVPRDSVVVAPGGRIVAGPLHNERGTLFADVDLERVGSARRSLDVVGHYARPDLFTLQVNRRPQQPVCRG